MVVQNQENQEEDENQVEESQIYYCAECKRSFSSGRALGGHMSRAHVQASKDLSIKNMKTEHTENFKLLCSEYTKEFSSRRALFGHMRSHPDRDLRGMEPPPSAGIIIGLPAPEYSSGIDLNQGLKCWNVTGKRGRPAATRRGIDSSNSKSTIRTTDDDLKKVREMVGNLKRHKSQGSDFSDHVKETKETGEKALEFSSKVTEIKGNDQGPARTQKTLKKSKEEGLMIKEDDSFVKMVENLKRHKSQGPDFLDQDKETNETGEKALGFSSKTESTKVTDIKGDDQGPARTQKKLKISKEKSLMIKEEDSAIKMVENLKRHKSQRPDFSDHDKVTNDTKEKALEFSSKTASTKGTEIKGDDQGPARTQKTLRKSKEKSLMIKEDDSALKMVENLKRHKSQGPDFSDHIKERTNETGEKALEFSSKTESTKVREIKGVDQGPTRTQKTLKKSKEKGLIMIKEDDSAVKMVENLKRHKSQGPVFSDHVKEINEIVEKALEFLSKTESTKVTEIKGDDQGPARTQKKLKKSKEKSLMIKEDDSAVKMVENLKRQNSQGPDFSDHDKETNETGGKALEFSSKTESMKVIEIKGDDQGPARLKKLKVKSLMKRQNSQGPDFADHMKETSEPDKKSPEFPSKSNELDSKNSTESAKAAEIEVDDHRRARTQEKSKEKSLIINEDDSAVEVPLKEGKFTCKKCGKSFRTHQAFGGHVASHEKMIIRIWNEIDHVHDNEQASETKKKMKPVKKTASVTDKVESGENTKAPVEENNETTIDTQPVVKGCSSPSNVPEKSTEIARKGFDFDLNEMPNEED